MAHDGVADGLSANHALSLCFALFCACPVVLWAGDMPAARRLAAMLLDHSARHSLAYWHFWGRCFDTALRRGPVPKGVGDWPELQHDPLFGPLHLETLGTLTEEPVSAEAIARAETGRAGWCSAEILRAQGQVILDGGASDAPVAAEAQFQRSLELARQHAALSWELRTATSLARLWRFHGRIRDANDLLAPVYARFTEGFGTADLVTAKALLAELVV